jgi:type I restriction enzyme M protein
MVHARLSEQPASTAQQLGSIIKSSRDIMRKDKGLNGDLDRLPMLTWIMFLKFLDDTERIREQEATLSRTRFRSAIDTPYRWRDWAEKEDGITGDELIAFINQEEAICPNGKKGPGLFTYLRSLQSANGGDRRDVIATVFRGTVNRMINGYLLRDVFNKINGIHFTSSDEIHTLSHLYESLLKEMRDSAGDSGEFYTPRPVVRFMVEAIDPQIGEVILDPACGTGGFLVESYGHLQKQCKTVQDMKILQENSFLGGEAKSLPYLLCQMNLLLHGLDYPQISPGNSLATPLREIGDKERVDIILTNPPFGGEEEKGILSNFPDDTQTTETALLFLQLIMRKLRRPHPPSGRGGRAAVIIPNGPLFSDGVPARVREALLHDFTLNTVVRLPNGVFAPYTPIPTNILFFEHQGPTSIVWFYELPLPEGRKNYTKTKPLTHEEFGPIKEWWSNRVPNSCAWTVSIEDLKSNGFNLDLHHPSARNPIDRTPPDVLVNQIVEKERMITELLSGLVSDLENAP